MIVVLLLYSGQHLITALAETMFGYKTTSWYDTNLQLTVCRAKTKWSNYLKSCFRELGRQKSNIELDTPSMKPEQVQVLEDAVNDKIRQHVPVSVKLLSIDDPEVEQVLTVYAYYYYV